MHPPESGPPGGHPPPEAAGHPYARLTPDKVLDALEQAGLRGDGRLLQLNSYENRVFQVFLEDGSSVVAKFYRPARWSDEQILEEHRFSSELAQAEIPVVAPLLLTGEAGSRSTLHCHDGFRFAVYPRRGGRAPELEDPAVLEWVGRFIGRIHALARQAPFAHRPSLDVHTFGEQPLEWLLAHEAVPLDVRAPWQASVEQSLALVRQSFERVAPLRLIRLHGDCHPGNILWTEQGPHFVDLDDARTGPAVQDLWMLLSGDASTRQRQISDVLAGYEDFCDFDWRELHLIEALRTLRILHHSAWLAMRWDDPAFPPAFPWFGSSSYWADQTVRLRDQIEEMQAAIEHL